VANSKEHGDRNRLLSQKLFDEADYFDWSITVAFYSAIHFVENRLFPCIINEQHCKNINDVKFAYKMDGRHASRERLVFDRLREIGPYYKWLDDKSRYARYTTFKINKNEAEKAIQYLNKIYKYCYPDIND